MSGGWKEFQPLKELKLPILDIHGKGNSGCAAWNFMDPYAEILWMHIVNNKCTTQNSGMHILKLRIHVLKFWDAHPGNTGCAS